MALALRPPMRATTSRYNVAPLTGPLSDLSLSYGTAKSTRSGGLRLPCCIPRGLVSLWSSLVPLHLSSGRSPLPHSSQIKAPAQERTGLKQMIQRPARKRPMCLQRMRPPLTPLERKIRLYRRFNQMRRGRDSFRLQTGQAYGREINKKDL